MLDMSNAVAVPLPVKESDQKPLWKWLTVNSLLAMR